MALFKIFRGPEDNLNSVPLHEGYAYFTEDKGNLFIDISNEEGGRLQVNAYAAQVLKNDITEIDIDDIFLKNMTATVAQGGTGHNSLTVNALLIGNGTNAVKMVEIAAGQVVIGNSENGVTGLQGTGALFAATAGAPQFGTLPISVGGTGAINAAGARTNLDVYSKLETDNQISGSTTAAYPATLSASGWVLNEDMYTYTYSNTSLTCGKAGNVPPIISYTSNLKEYSKIDHADASVGVGITFYTKEKPTNDIAIIIIDVK